MKLREFVILALGIFAGCSVFGSGSEAYNPEIEPGVYRFDFETGTQGWMSIFTGIPVDKEEGNDYAERVELQSDHRSLPSEVRVDGEALFISGFVGDPGMGLFFKRQIDGLTPGATYMVQFEVEMASNISSDCGGYGGIPGQSPVLGIASLVEPTRILEEGQYVNMYAFDETTSQLLKEEQAKLGTVGIDDYSCLEGRDMGFPYRLKQLGNGANMWTATTNDEGQLWILVGTVSTAWREYSFYYNTITVRLEEQDS